ncbi:uncharacterized protein LOC122627918 isoform X1 [Vespula pensylvanica]|uniref:Uncharacterized protein n=1 Tax=Vespula pensylvanica TaxID=30213 RepID=A0A834UDC6_VESPE|nr:uncharacterized protein LOC122627918 isoform X1 [Vespula pensylvanica]XP_043665487.1 uncharacterized protein LOC122627918 isoform X1 [Vespula pensylvanica]KAF7432003.1 hypothetical protein H0235_004927 [Vespula pensylvanica]
MQGEQQRGRTSRASSTSSLGREVRCGCQYYQSDSLLPERQARIARPSSRTAMQEPSRHPCSEHEYEPIAAPLAHPVTAPVVQIIDTDVVPVADSDDSIDERGLLPPRLILGGDVILPLDGRIEDVAMEGQELGETVGDTSEEQDSPQQLQDRLEERYLSSPSPSAPTPIIAPTTPGAESRTDGEVNTSQMDSSVLEELPLRRDAKTLPQRLKSQAGKLSSRLRGIQRPNFSFTKRQKAEKTRSTSSGKSDKSRTEKKRPSRMDRIRTSFAERPRFNLPERPKFSLPDRSKIRLPERPKFHLPEKAKFNMKRPNISLPSALKRTRKSTLREQRSTDSTIGGSRRNIFDFSTYPRIFEKKSKTHADDYAATSSPKDSRAQSQESATFPRTRKTYPSTTASWTRRFGDPTFDEFDQDENVSAAERTRPWRHPSLEEPRLSVRLEEKDTLAARISWEKSQRKGASETMEEDEEMQYMDYDPDSAEISEGREINEKQKRSENGQLIESDWRPSDEEVVAEEEIFKPIRRSRSLADPTSFDVGSSFSAVDPRQFEQIPLPSEEEREKERAEEEIEEEDYEEEELEEELEELEDRDLSSAHSDREQQQSSGSSCDRRRRGIVEDTGSEEYYPRDNMADFDKYFQPVNALADDFIMPTVPPKRPARRSLYKRKEDSVESYDVVIPPTRAKRERMVARASEDISDDVFYEERSDSSSRHRVVYQAECDPRELTKSTNEPLDDIVIVKPARRKSKSSLRSQSQAPIESDISRNIFQNGDVPRPPPVVPTRRKRARGAKIQSEANELFPTTICNGRSDKWEENLLSSSRMAEPVQSRAMNDIILDTQEDKILLEDQLAQTPIPIPPKRRSRSRTISLAQDEDRTSHGAESLPEIGYVQEDIPPDETTMDSMRDLSGYALVDKREKPPRPPPPRRRKIREKFATTPRPSPPKRPQRTYSTLASTTKIRDDFSTEERLLEQQQTESMPYIEIDSEDRKELRDDRVLSKIQGRPLPAPPRPPRARKEHSQDRFDESLSELINEATTATQTDPLPDDMIIEEEITQAKLIVTPSRSGSQVMVSTERIPSPNLFPTSTSELLQNDDEKYQRMDTPRSSRGPSPFVDYEERLQERHSPTRTQFAGEPPPTIPDTTAMDQSHLHSIIRSALLTDETLRISSLEVGDLKVDRLNVSQLETSKLLASEIDSVVICTNELKNLYDSKEDSFSPSIIKELIAIRSHLESVASSQQAREERRLLDRENDTESTVKDSTKVDVIPDRDDQKKIKSYEEKDSVTDQSVKIESKLDDKKSSEETKKDREIENIEVESASHTLSFVESMQDDTLETVDPMSMKRSEIFEVVEGKRSTEIHQAPHSDAKLSLMAEFDIMSERRPEIDIRDFQDKQFQSKEETNEISRESRSRSPSPTERIRPVRQTASPVRSLPPVISVTPDTPDVTTPYNVSNVALAQRAVISYSDEAEKSDRQEAAREISQSPITSNLPSGAAHFIAFPTSQIPAEFFSLTTSPSTRVEPEPSILESSKQLLRAIRITGAKLIRDFASHLISRVGAEEATEKIRELELALCALLLVIAILLIVYFSNSRTIMHYHHWDYFNPPQ